MPSLMRPDSQAQGNTEIINVDQTARTSSYANCPVELGALQLANAYSNPHLIG